MDENKRVLVVPSCISKRGDKQGLEFVVLFV